MPEQSRKIEDIRRKVLLTMDPLTRNEILVLFQELDRASAALDQVYGETLRYYNNSDRQTPG